MNIKPGLTIINKKTGAIYRIVRDRGDLVDCVRVGRAESQCDEFSFIRGYLRKNFLEVQP